MGHMIELRAADGVVSEAYVAQPKREVRASIVVLQEIFGVNAHIRAVADGFALAGFLVVAPATFSRIQKHVNLGYTEKEVASGRALKNQAEALPAPGVMAEVQAAITHASMASRGKVGVVGYCWGGLLTWRSAALVEGLSAAVPYYGGGSTNSEEIARHPKCPVMAHYAKQDHWIGLDTVDAFAKAHPEVAVHLYEADHGFNCDHRGSYQKVSADLARERTLSFFEEHLA